MRQIVIRISLVAAFLMAGGMVSARADGPLCNPLIDPHCTMPPLQSAEQHLPNTPRFLFGAQLRFDGGSNGEPTCNPVTQVCPPPH